MEDYTLIGWLVQAIVLGAIAYFGLNMISAICQALIAVIKPLLMLTGLLIVLILIIS